jgi:hypothetical protein
MKTALYIGTHRQDSLSVRLGWAATRLVQKGAYGRVTHCEAIHAEYPDGFVDIASASLRDGGVRTKHVKLTPGAWIIVDVPSWQVSKSRLWFSTHNGEPYDLRGAVATVLPGRHQKGRWFCNEAIGASVGMLEPHTFGPHHFAAIALTLGTDITEQFFGERA